MANNFAPLPRFLNIRRIDTFTIKNKMFMYKDFATKQITKSQALHRASCHGICRGRERLYVLIEDEKSGQLYLEEAVVDPVTKKTEFWYIEDENEWKHILAYITWHLLGATQMSATLKEKLDRKIRNLAGISQADIERLTITNPDFMTVRTVVEDAVEEDEEQREELKKRD